MDKIFPNLMKNINLHIKEDFFFKFQGGKYKDIDT